MPNETLSLAAILAATTLAYSDRARFVTQANLAPNIKVYAYTDTNAPTGKN